MPLVAGYILKHITTDAARIGEFDCAAYYARQVLMTRFTLAWLATTTLFELRWLILGNSRSRASGIAQFCTREPGTVASTARGS